LRWQEVSRILLQVDRSWVNASDTNSRRPDDPISVGCEGFLRIPAGERCALNAIQWVTDPAVMDGSGDRMIPVSHDRRPGDAQAMPRRERRVKKAIRVVLIVAGSLAALAAINFAPMVSLKVPGMHRYTASGITVHAMPKDAVEVEVVAARIAERSAAIVQALGGGSQDQVGLIIYPSRKALHRKTIGFAGAFLPDWFIGDNTKRYVLITSPGAPGPSHSRESITQAAVHEYVHVITDRANHDLGYWLKEGIALYLADQRPQPEMILAHADITYAEFAAPSALQFAAVGGYALAYTLVEYLTVVYGWDRVVQLSLPGATYQSVLGVPEKTLFEQWRAWRGPSSLQG
jgi:hypothetical protein